MRLIEPKLRGWIGKKYYDADIRYFGINDGEKEQLRETGMIDNNKMDRALGYND